MFGIHKIGSPELERHLPDLQPLSKAQIIEQLTKTKAELDELISVLGSDNSATLEKIYLENTLDIINRRLQYLRKHLSGIKHD